MRVRILYHDHCFDGAASAAFFSRFIEGKFHPDAEFSFTGMAHKASQLFEPELFDAFSKNHAGQKCGNEDKALGGAEEPEGLIRKEPKR